MRKSQGFTLIELLIVVAIIAILAAIAIPNFLEAQIRAKVSRCHSDMRSLATALESYFVDNNTYPPMGWNVDTTPDALKQALEDNCAGRTFRIRSGDPGDGENDFHTLTTPVAYITSYPPDPFATTKGITFRYYNTNQGFIMGTFGPDTDENAGGDLGWNQGDLRNRWTSTDRYLDADIETVYRTEYSQPCETLLVGGPGTAAYHSDAATAGFKGSFTYDPTNGTVSAGDVWRVKQ
jgi:prepilin-type N-terminal cleavage/methylation domain-containing protein